MPSVAFEQLLADCLDGNLDAEGAEALAGEITRVRSSAHAFDEALALEALLFAAHREAPDAVSIILGVTRRASDRLARRRPLRWLAAAAVLFAVGLGAVLAIVTRKEHPNKEHPNKVLAGRVLMDGREVKSVPYGVWVKAADGEEAEILLEDGSNVKLAPASKVRFRGAEKEVRQVVDLHEGEGRFKVEKGNRQFRVETPVGTVTVLGTEFSVKLEPVEGKGAEEMVKKAQEHGMAMTEKGDEAHIEVMKKMKEGGGDPEEYMAKTKAKFDAQPES